MNERRGFLLKLTVALAILATAASLHAKDVPFLAGRVNDLALLLNSGTETRLDQRLRTLEESTGAQVVVLTIESLEGDSLEEYAHRVATTWKLGRVDVDDGALLLIARDDRKMRIEVGYGLEGAVPDILAKRILDDIVRPRFRGGLFEEGIEAGVDALAGLIAGDPHALPPPRAAQSRPRGPGLFVALATMGLPLLFFSLTAIATRGGKGWAFWLFLAPFWYILPHAAIGAMAAVGGLTAWLVFVPLLRVFLRRTVTGNKTLDGLASILAATASSGTWSSSGGWSGGGGGGGGGFSGGGGSFGGGGASSGW